MKQKTLFCSVKHGVMLLSFITIIGFSLVGCMDNNYDLTDLDTNVGVSVNNLTIPLNLDPITMNTIVDLDADSKIKKVFYGGDSIYALIDEGEFHSKEIKIPSFKTTVTDIDKNQTSLELQEFFLDIPESIPDEYLPKLNDTIITDYPINVVTTKLTAHTDNVDKSVKGITYITVKPTALKVNIDVSSLRDHLKTIHIEDLKLQLPKGLDITGININGTSYSSKRYSKSTGVLDLATESAEYQDKIKDNMKTVNGEFDLALTLIGIDATAAGVTLDADPDGKNPGVLNFVANCEGLKWKKEGKDTSGRIKIWLSDFINYTGDGTMNVREVKTKLYDPLYEKLPRIDYIVSPNIDPIEAEEFNGKIRYALDDFNIDPVKLEGIPDFLSGEGTKIFISNPQIYLDINNPLLQKGYKLTAQTGFELTPKWDNGSVGETLSMDEPLVVKTDKEQQRFYLSPKECEPYESQWQGAQHVSFKNLSKVVYDETRGLPNSIQVSPSKPEVPEQTIENFKLGETIEKVQGNYTFFVPFELSDTVDGEEVRSEILYTKEESTWDEEALEKLNLTGLKLNFDVSIDSIPYDILLTINPYQKDAQTGKKVLRTDIVGTLDIPSKSKNYHAELVMKENDNERISLKNLCGVKLVATIKCHKGKPLSPDMQIQIKNLKATVSGTYEDEL